MVEMIANTLKRYAGRDLKPGDRFDVDEDHVKTLRITRLARVAEGKDGVGNEYQTRQMISKRRKDA